MKYYPILTNAIAMTVLAMQDYPGMQVLAMSATFFLHSAIFSKAAFSKIFSVSAVLAGVLRDAAIISAVALF